MIYPLGRVYIPLIVILFSILSFADMERIDIRPSGYDGYRIGDMEILSQFRLDYDDIDGVPFREISDIAYDDGNHTLYMVGDEGELYLFDAIFSKSGIERFEPVAGYRLQDRSGVVLRGKMADAEGMDIDSSGVLGISFERVPRVELFDRKGVEKRSIALPEPLSKKGSYRGKNSQLEALLHHSALGWLTSPERPLFGNGRRIHAIYSLENGRVWRFVGEKSKRDSITSLEEISPDSILVLERIYEPWDSSLTIVLRRVFLNDCDIKRICRSEIVARLGTSEGWRPDNFEALTRVGRGRYLMISDDNDSPLQSTIMVLFKLCNEK